MIPLTLIIQNKRKPANFCRLLGGIFNRKQKYKTEMAISCFAGLTRIRNLLNYWVTKCRVAETGNMLVVSHSFGCWSPSEYINADNSKRLGLLGNTENYNLQISLLHIIPEQPWTFHELFFLSGDELTLIYRYWSSLIHSYWQQGGTYSWNDSHIAIPCNLYGRKWNFQNICFLLRWLWDIRHPLKLKPQLDIVIFTYLKQMTLQDF